MKRLLFSVRGGPAIGMGHVTRSVTLGQYLGRTGFSLAGYMGNPDLRSRALIEGAGFQFYEAPADDPDAAAQIRTLVAELQPDTLVLDQPTDLRALSRAARSARDQMRIAALDHFDYANTAIDLFINLFNHNPEGLRAIGSGLAYYEGACYGIIRESFRPWIDRPKTIHSDVQELLVTFGGSDPSRHTLTVIDLLQALHWPGAVTIIIGSNYLHRKEIRRRLESVNFSHRIEENLAAIEEPMFRADLAICSGGTTMLELAAVGTPYIVMPQIPEEDRFANDLAAKGVALNAGFDAHQRLPRLREALRGLSGDPRERERMSRAGKTLVDGRGVKRIAELLQKPLPKRSRAA